MKRKDTEEDSISNPTEKSMEVWMAELWTQTHPAAFSLPHEHFIKSLETNIAKVVSVIIIS